MDVIKYYQNFAVPYTGEYDKYWEWVAIVSNRRTFIAMALNDLATTTMIAVYLPHAEGTGYSSMVWWWD